mmetsp:Transcript_1898/g.3426  ORF Transcript_1898/g.3426 Transcript_1898/m.3426 type:complete len:122 (+) Transcript_1898:1163-1528(+)
MAEGFRFTEKISSRVLFFLSLFTRGLVPRDFMGSVTLIATFDWCCDSEKNRERVCSNGTFSRKLLADRPNAAQGKLKSVALLSDFNAAVSISIALLCSVDSDRHIGIALRTIGPKAPETHR